MYKYAGKGSDRDRERGKWIAARIETASKSVHNIYLMLFMCCEINAEHVSQLASGGAFHILFYSCKINTHYTRSHTYYTPCVWVMSIVYKCAGDTTKISKILSDVDIFNFFSLKFLLFLMSWVKIHQFSIQIYGQFRILYTIGNLCKSRITIVPCVKSCVQPVKIVGMRMKLISLFVRAPLRFSQITSSARVWKLLIAQQLWFFSVFNDDWMLIFFEIAIEISIKSNQIKSNTLPGYSFCSTFPPSLSLSVFNGESPCVILHRVFHFWVHSSSLNCIPILHPWGALKYTTYRTCTHAHTNSCTQYWMACVVRRFVWACKHVCQNFLHLSLAQTYSHIHNWLYVRYVCFDDTKCEPALCFEYSSIDPHNNDTNGLMYILLVVSHLRSRKKIQDKQFWCQLFYHIRKISC